MDYRPDVTSGIDRFLVGLATNEEAIETSVRSESVLKQDRAMLIRNVTDLTHDTPVNDLRLRYDSKSYVPLAAGNRYLLAVSGGHCVGLLPVEGSEVRVPGAGNQDLLAFARAHIHQPFPDYLGSRAGIVPPDPSIPDITKRKLR